MLHAQTHYYILHGFMPKVCVSRNVTRIVELAVCPNLIAGLCMIPAHTRHIPPPTSLYSAIPVYDGIKQGYTSLIGLVGIMYITPYKGGMIYNIPSRVYIGILKSITPKTRNIQISK